MPPPKNYSLCWTRARHPNLLLSCVRNTVPPPENLSNVSPVSLPAFIKKCCMHQALPL